jgi:ferredoxin
MRIRVDLDLCQGHGTCAEEAPDVFAVDARTTKVIVRIEEPPEALRKQVLAAVKYCPTQALKLVEA